MVKELKSIVELSKMQRVHRNVYCSKLNDKDRAFLKSKVTKDLNSINKSNDELDKKIEVLRKKRLNVYGFEEVKISLTHSYTKGELVIWDDHIVKIEKCFGNKMYKIWNGILCTRSGLGTEHIIHEREIECSVRCITKFKGYETVDESKIGKVKK